MVALNVNDLGDDFAVATTARLPRAGPEVSRA
jgi:hypothetical protein